VSGKRGGDETVEDAGRARDHLLHREKAEASVLDQHKTGPPRHPGLKPRVFLDIAQGGFPWGTLLVNVLACLLMGLLTTYLLKGRPHAVAKPLLVTGYLGGFSTFSHLIDGIDSLARAGSWGLSVTYAVVSVVGGLIAIVVGLRLGGAIPHPSDRAEGGAAS
jgi:CrcB protein